MLICTDCNADADVTGKCRPAYVLDESALYSAQMACKGEEDPCVEREHGSFQRVFHFRAF
jgi:hypothetical protein